jgi:hypothetical protein
MTILVCGNPFTTHTHRASLFWLFFWLSCCVPVCADLEDTWYCRERCRRFCHSSTHRRSLLSLPSHCPPKGGGFLRHNVESEGWTGIISCRLCRTRAPASSDGRASRADTGSCAAPPGRRCPACSSRIPPLSRS